MGIVGSEGHWVIVAEVDVEGGKGGVAKVEPPHIVRRSAVVLRRVATAVPHARSPPAAADALNL